MADDDSSRADTAVWVAIGLSIASILFSLFIFWRQGVIESHRRTLEVLGWFRTIDHPCYKLTWFTSKESIQKQTHPWANVTISVYGTNVTIGRNLLSLEVKYVRALFEDCAAMLISVLTEVKLGLVQPQYLTPLIVYITYLLGDDGDYKNKPGRDGSGKAIMIANPKVDVLYFAELHELRHRIRTWYYIKYALLSTHKTKTTFPNSAPAAPEQSTPQYQISLQDFAHTICSPSHWKSK
jgi:hypothetical protein